MILVKKCKQERRNDITINPQKKLSKKFLLVLFIKTFPNPEKDIIANKLINMKNTSSTMII